MRNRTIIVTMFLMVLLAGLAVAADVSGKWTYTTPTRDGGTREASMTLKQDGSTVTGTVQGRQAEQPISEGKIDGNNISFKVKMQMGDNAVVMNYKGVIAGDEIKFKSTREGGEQPPREFTAKRAK